MRDVRASGHVRIMTSGGRALEEMDYLQEGINLRAVGQKVPLSSGSARATRCSAAS